MMTSADPDGGLVSPERVLHAALATDFLCFVEYAFGLVRPGVAFRMNWHIDALAHKLAQVATGRSSD
jgi:hypothetical protein